MAEETHEERVNRELIELLNELRVALPGVQVLFAFLLAVPFSQRFDQVTELQRDAYMVALLSTLAGSVFLIAPAAYHRIRFRDRDKEALLQISNVFAIVGMVFLALGMTAVVFLVTDLLFKDTVTAVVTTLTAALFAVGLVRAAAVRASRRTSPGVPPAQDRRQPVRVDVAARDDADELPPRHLARERRGDGERTCAFGDHPDALGQQPDGGRGLVERHRVGAGEQRAGSLPHRGQHHLRARSVDERGPELGLARLARLERGRHRRARLGLHGVDGQLRPEGGERARDPGEEAAAAPGDEHGVRVRKLLGELDPDRAVPGHHALVLHGMDEQPFGLVGL